MIKKILIIAFLFSCLNNINAQKNVLFTSDSVKFIKELNDYFYDFSANKKDAEEYMIGFTKMWKSPEFSSIYKQSMYKTCNTMLQRKLKPFPYFIGYMNAVVNCIESKQERALFENWQTLL